MNIFNTGEWHSFEIKAVIDQTTGEYRVYMDGTEIITVTGVDSDNFGNITRTYVGKYYDYGSPIGTWKIDNIVVSDEHIGP